MFCCKTFLFLFIAVLKKRYISLLSPWPAAILMLWVNVGVGRTICLHFLAKQEYLVMFIQSVAHYNLVLGKDFFFFNLKIFAFLEEKKFNTACNFPDLQHFSLLNFPFGEWYQNCSTQAQSPIWCNWGRPLVTADFPQGNLNATPVALSKMWFQGYLLKNENLTPQL